MTDMIAVDGLTKHFGPIAAVQGVSFRVGRGEVLGFLGPNGAGKTTTMRMITGFLPPTSGVAKVCGFNVATNPIDAKKKIGYLPEGAPSYFDMTAAAYLNFIASVRGLSGADKRKHIDKAVERAHIREVFDRPIETLSKGYKRRVALAQAIVHDPEVLVLDEPTEGLDPNQKHEVRTLIRDMAPDKAIIISTHLLEEVEPVCSRAIVIARGRIVADGRGRVSRRRKRRSRSSSPQAYPPDDAASASCSPSLCPSAASRPGWARSTMTSPASSSERTPAPTSRSTMSRWRFSCSWRIRSSSPSYSMTMSFFPDAMFMRKRMLISPTTRSPPR